MVIRELNREECLRVLAQAEVARLACAHENQPYVVPVSLAYDETSGCLYGFTTPGQKVEWMRTNPLVCVEVDEIAACDRWVSVIATGRYEELPAAPEPDEEPAPARQGLAREPGLPCAANRGDLQSEEGAGNSERKRAWHVLKTRPRWWEPGSAAWAARAQRDSDEPFVLVYYKIRIDHVTGHETTRDTRDAAPAPPAGKWEWMHRTLVRLFGVGPKDGGLAP
ncbi:pyridoxamine 5'-phosphate oxidase family protein [Frigoriglobus tundricola]|uniref:Pyridoxamine 5'-phosphate oxidase putative domain-containing protein n=1 Tax=Frigoriglobus tundricola TaxID=2774151 RepID=A0A6M5Z6F5_9BACT|nr:pyridoxamine 5'-phosphate oxidase family protein [Frigoriglobus tundricola]QJX01265.1 hypothetical protein FTUN_8905 [Frigoriglobus tundricola]